jgi:hypothetical protein
LLLLLLLLLLLNCSETELIFSLIIIFISKISCESVDDCSTPQSCTGYRSSFFYIHRRTDDALAGAAHASSRLGAAAAA